MYLHHNGKGVFIVIRIFENKCRDRAVVVDDTYIIYDKVDRSGQSCEYYSDELLQKYISNGFKELASRKLSKIKYD